MKPKGQLKYTMVDKIVKLIDLQIYVHWLEDARHPMLIARATIEHNLLLYSICIYRTQNNLL